jgi:type VI secretion system protein ImpI
MAAGTALGDRSGEMQKLIDGLAEATGLTPEAFADLPPDELGRMLGRFMMLTLENLKDLLDARASAKSLARSTRRTMVQAVDNNPVKFLPTAADALKVVLNDKINGYLPYDRALTESFNDIKQHQIETYAAMRYALSRLVEEIAPETIERETPSSGGLMPNKDARRWRTFLTKWNAMAAGQDGGMNERFMLHFAEFYDRER